MARKRISLRLWYEICCGFAIGLPAYKLDKVLETNDYKKVYGAYKVIRLAIVERSKKERSKLTGAVEVDESYGIKIEEGLIRSILESS